MLNGFGAASFNSFFLLSLIVETGESPRAFARPLRQHLEIAPLHAFTFQATKRKEPFGSIQKFGSVDLNIVEVLLHDFDSFLSPHVVLAGWD